MFKKIIATTLTATMLLFSGAVASSASANTQDVVNQVEQTTNQVNDTVKQVEDTSKQVEQKTTEVQKKVDEVKNKKLHVSKDDKVIGGVCGGLAEYFGIDVDLVRAGFVILGLATGIGVIAYLVLWIVMD
ncbi:PspC domain-containing protein [Priestia aryabhattai]|uniref:PspC domain-containing protein n=1 Tax=Priestia aryabhattai TaxID=412384 RepID=UPI0039A0A0DD